MQKRRFILIFALIFFIISPANASNLCSTNCLFNEFFKCNYKELIEYLNPNEERRYIFDMLFRAYSIKFEGLDFEYKAKCEALEHDENSDEITSHCINEQKKYLKGLTEIAREEYDNFLDDLSFEICGCENAENRAVKKHKKRYRRALRKLIAKNCR